MQDLTFELFLVATIIEKSVGMIKWQLLNMAPSPPEQS